MDKYCNLLIVDDNVDDYEYYLRLLQNIPGKAYRCIPARDGNKALQLLDSEQLDCVLVDYSLPGMDGLEVLKNIRARSPFLPVILLTGHGSEAIAVEAIKCGANDYLTKPLVNKEHLHHVISTSIDLSIEERNGAEPESLSVLIVDDHLEDLEKHIRLLKKTSNTAYRFVEANDGRTALECLDKASFDCVLLDYSLPDMDGLEVLKNIRISQPFLPVILLTGEGSETIAAQAIKKGANDYFAKSTMSADRLHRAIVEAAERGVMQRNIANKDAKIKEKTEALAQSEERYDLTVRGLSIGVWDWNAITNEVYWSDKFKSMVGITDNDFEVHYQDFVDRLHPDDKETTMNMFHAHLGRLGPYNVEYRLKHNNGHYIWIHATGQAKWDANGKPVRMAGSVNDISRRKRAEEQREEVEQALKASEETFRSAIEDASIGMTLVATNGRLLKVNKALCNLLGYTEYELLTHDFQSITHPDDLPEDLEYVRRTLAGEIKTYQMEKRYRRKSGRIVWALLSVSLVRHASGEPNYFISQIQDITERKEMERMKSEFISVVSHELRTPLTSIRGSLGLLAGTMTDDLPEKANRLIDIAYNNSERLILLVNDILDIDRIASGQMPFDIREEALSPIIQQAIEANQPYADKFSVSIIALPIDSELRVSMDPARLLQVLANLLSNASKFSNQGDNVEVGCVQTGEFVRIEVTDRGPGIPEEFRTRIFGKFSQADSSGTRAKGGTGLGLYISKQIVQHMSGHIGFETEIGKGSTFWVELPIVP